LTGSGRCLMPGAIGDSLAARGIRLSLGGTVCDANDPMGKMFFNILATFAEF
jgi:DNA invertase Pin-like site-specific DNA recombinase